MKDPRMCRKCVYVYSCDREECKPESALAHCPLWEDHHGHTYDSYEKTLRFRLAKWWSKNKIPVIIIIAVLVILALYPAFIYFVANGFGGNGIGTPPQPVG